MDAQFIKARLREYAKAHPRDIARVAELAGVSERTVQRWMSPDNDAIPSLLQLAKIWDHWDLSMDMLLFPERFNSAAHDTLGATAKDPIPFGKNVFENIPLSWFDADWNMLYCSQAFSRLFDLEPVDMIGKNLKVDFAYYGEEGYAWLEQGMSETKSQVCQAVMDEARTHGDGTAFTWFVARDGYCRRVLIRCWALDDGTYLFADVPCVHEGWDLYNRILSAQGNQYTYSLENENGRTITVPDESQQVVLYFCQGHSVGECAKLASVERSQAAEYLNQWRYAFMADDFEHLREILIQHAADEIFCDHYSIMRMNARNLK